MLSTSEINGELVVLWFSMTGAFIDVGDGPLFTINYEVNANAPDGVTVIDAVAGTTFSDDLGQSLYWGSEPSEFAIGLPDVILSMVQTSDTSFDIYVDNAYDIQGFQIEIADTPDNFTFVSIEGSERVPADWALSGNENAGNFTLLGFSFSGTLISAGSGALATVTMSAEAGEYDTEMCFDNYVLSDPSGQAYYAFADCATFTNPFGPSEFTQEVNVDAMTMNMVSFNIESDDMSTDAILGGLDILVAKNDASEFYVPSFGVDQIGTLDVTEGYKVFLNGMDAQTISVTGQPATGSVAIAPFMMNMISYLPQECIATDQVFAGYEDDILIVKNDSGDYFVPSFGVMTLTELCPGEGYAIFLNGTDGIDFTYPSSGLARTASTDMWEEYNMQSAPTHYDVTPTGISHPIILNDISGEVSLGDEVAAYANGELVGATKVVDQDLVVLSAWGGYHDADLGINLEGYAVGDAIELRVWSQLRGKELRVETNLSTSTYGDSPLTGGGVVVTLDDAQPTDYALTQNYPNPFNPSTTIEFNVGVDSHVSINVYDITGRLVSTIADGYYQSGTDGYSVTWNGLDSQGRMVSAGLYIYTLQTDNQTITRKMVLMK